VIVFIGPLRYILIPSTSGADLSLLRKGTSRVGRYLANSVASLVDDTNQSGQGYGILPIDSILSANTSVISGTLVVIVAH